MTKTEYAQYFQSEDWQQRRKEAITQALDMCERCQLPRWVASLVYDQDLHVHHRNYQNVGDEQPEDLEVLCRRCHEIETFRRSDFKEIKTTKCSYCDQIHWNVYSDYCPHCNKLYWGELSSFYFDLKCVTGQPLWRTILRELADFVSDDGEQIQEVFNALTDALKRRAVAEFRQLHPEIQDDDSDITF